MTGLSLFVVAVLGLTVWLVTDDAYVAPAPKASDGEVLDPSDARRLLERLEAAVVGRDAPAAAALARSGDEDAVRLLEGVVANAGELRVRDFSLRYVDLASRAAPGEWGASVDVTWRFAGFDRDPARVEVEVGLVEEDGEARLVSLGGGHGRSPLWLGGPLEVRRSAGSLVLVDGRPAEADRYARLADRAVPVVRAVLEDWEPRLVVEVPESLEALAQALGADPATYDEIAAVTTSVDGSREPGAPVHVLVNPEVLGRLRTAGQQVVMSHEAAHVAVDAAASSTPLWLLEGFADYVALRDVDLPVSRTASQVIGQVRRDGPPNALPAAADFDSSGKHLGGAYEGAWLACRLLAQRGGEEALVELYDAVDSGEAVDPALRRLFGLSERALTREWQRLLTDLAA